MGLETKLNNIVEKTTIFVGFSSCIEAMQYGVTYVTNNDVDSNPLFSVFAGAGLTIAYYIGDNSDKKNFLDDIRKESSLDNENYEK